jgi:histone deacetylase 11
MNVWYLLSLNFTFFVCKAVEMPIPLPGWLLRMKLLEPMQCATQGSVDAACMAVEHRWAINLGGGYHHATRVTGGGFCIFPDITFVTHYLEKWYGMKRFMIIDLDAHQGNGHERDHTDLNKFYIIDAYNHDIYPGDSYAKQFIQDDIRISQRTTDDQFCQMISTSMKTCF